MLEISNKRSLENPQMQIKQNTLPNNPWIKEEITGIRKYCKLNENEDVLYIKNCGQQLLMRCLEIYSLNYIYYESWKVKIVYTSSLKSRRVKQRMRRKQRLEISEIENEAKEKQ